MFPLSSRNALAVGFAALPLVALVPVAAFAQSTTAPVPTVPLPAPSASSGAAVPTPIIMVIDDQRVVGNSKAYKSVQTQIDAQRDALQKEFSAKQNELEAAANDFARDQRSGTLSADAVEEKRHSLVKRQEEMKRDAESRQHALQQGYAEALDKIKQALLEVVQGLSHERHANLVLIRTDLILYDPAYDASADALARLDQKLTSVQVVVPSAATASAGTAASTAAAPAKKK